VSSVSARVRSGEYVVTAHVDGQVKALLVARLREQRAAGDLSSAEVRVAAREIGVGERTLWRWLARTEPPPLRRWRRRGW
jgi:putative transposase